jgi:hypothetical protein
LRKGIFGTLAGCEQNVLGGEQKSKKTGIEKIKEQNHNTRT